MPERAKPLNAKTRESLNVALLTIHDEWQYLNEAIKPDTPASLKERFIEKRNHLQRAGEWLESKLASTED